jgi:hypothetical protein
MRWYLSVYTSGVVCGTDGRHYLFYGRKTYAIHPPSWRQSSRDVGRECEEKEKE